jgi:hypothetical protein
VTRPDLDEDEEMRDQEAASILLLRVALRLLGEARLRGDFGGDEKLAQRAVAIADEITGGAPSPHPRRPVIEASLIRPDRISLSAPFDSSSSTAWSLMVDGSLYGGMTVTGDGFVEAEEPEELSEEEEAERERLQAEWRVRTERIRQFTAARFVRALTPPSQPGSSRPILAVLLYENGFYVESTYDKDAPTFDPEMDARQFFAVQRGEEPMITVTDDVGSEYFESGGGGSGGVRRSHASLGFAPAPPPAARVLRVTTDDTTVELPLRGQASSSR